MDIKNIEELTQILLDSKSLELAVSWDETSLYIKKPACKKPSKKAPVKKQDSNVEAAKESLKVKSSKVGIFYFNGKEIKVGDEIKKGDLVGFVDALKIKNEVFSEVSGTVKEVLVDDTYPVEYGQVLLVLED